jgi:hypothetical protein
MQVESYLPSWENYCLRKHIVCTSFTQFLCKSDRTFIDFLFTVDRDELHLLYKNFVAIAPDNQLTQEQFAAHFSPFTQSCGLLLVKSLFNAVDR